MASGVDAVENLKMLIRAFTAELDTTAMPYVNTGLLGSDTLNVMSEADRRAGKPGVVAGSMKFDAGRSTELRWEATDLKRQGQYLSSAEKTIESFRLDGHFDLVNLRNLWKTALCGGDASGAVALIRKAIDVFERYEIARGVEQLPVTPHEDLADVLGALRAEESTRSRLRDFAGNPQYVLPRSYEAIRADLEADGIFGVATTSERSGAKSSGGCYIATAVYGSYDAPEVKVLRRFRDERLQETVLGRRFVAAYYALSPSMAVHLPRHPRMSEIIRRALDRIVALLDKSS